MAQENVTDSTVAIDMQNAQDNFTELYLTKAEVEAARKSEADLESQIDYIQNQISSAVAGSGVLVDLTDTLGVLEDKLYGVNGVSITKISFLGAQILVISGEELQSRIETLENNLVLESFRRMIGDSQVGADAFENGWVDTLQDESNVDGSSTLWYYDSDSDYITNLPNITFLSGGTPSASTEFNAASNSAKAFDDDLATYWRPTGTNDWIMYDLGIGIETVPVSYSISGNDNLPLDEWVLEGSINGSDWTQLDSQSGQTFGYSTTTKTFLLTNTIAYRYFRITLVSSGNLYALYEWKMFEELQNSTIIFDAYEAESEPTDSKAIFIMEAIDTITLNTDIKAWASNDDGSTYEQITLEDTGDWETGQAIIVGTEEMTAVTDQTTRLKITTHNLKELKIHAVSNLLREA